MNKQPAFDVDYRRGLIGENLVGTFLEALAGSLIEVKTDFRVLETGNVFVETHQYPASQQEIYEPSGINVTAAEWYCIAGPSGNGFIAIKKDALMALTIQAPRADVQNVDVKSNKSRGRLVKITDLIQTIYKKENQ